MLRLRVHPRLIAGHGRRDGTGVGSCARASSHGVEARRVGQTAARCSAVGVPCYCQLLCSAGTKPDEMTLPFRFFFFLFWTFARFRRRSYRAAQCFENLCCPQIATCSDTKSVYFHLQARCSRVALCGRVIYAPSETQDGHVKRQLQLRRFAKSLTKSERIERGRKL